ncbi:MAG: YraN family protein [Candidatus Magasanikbacteria bacterium]|nr:YraN family protein [Candidatus Magasanikbacteria bacterium]
MTHNQSWGKFGEDLAARFLERRGFIIKGRNFRTRYGEIDIVAEKDGHLHFVEVKTRASEAFGIGEEAIHYLKRQNLLMAARLYLSRGGIFNPAQFDSLAILIDRKQKKARIRFSENIFGE